jgi:hypothetical protein
VSSSSSQHAEFPCSTPAAYSNVFASPAFTFTTFTTLTTTSTSQISSSSSASYAHPALINGGKYKLKTVTGEYTKVALDFPSGKVKPWKQPNGVDDSYYPLAIDTFGTNKYL